MKTLNSIKLFVLPLLLLTLTACGGMQTFNDYARAGDTVAIAAGMQPDFSKNNVKVDFYIPPRIDRSVLPNPVSDIPFATYNTGDSAIRGTINFYADPVSSIVVSRQTNQDLTFSARNYAQTMGFITNNDHDWFQTTVYVDLPDTLPLGTAEIVVSNGLGDFNSSTVEVIGTGGTPSTFNAWSVGNLNPTMFESLARIDHYTIDLDSASVPYAIEVNLSHLNTGGVPFVINPLGYKKNLSWSETSATTMKVILLPAESSTISSMKDYKFYIAGGINGLNVDSVNAYDINGQTAVDVVTATAILK